MILKVWNMICSLTGVEFVFCLPERLVTHPITHVMGDWSRPPTPSDPSIHYCRDVRGVCKGPSIRLLWCRESLACTLYKFQADSDVRMKEKMLFSFTFFSCQIYLSRDCGLFKHLQFHSLRDLKSDNSDAICRLCKDWIFFLLNFQKWRIWIFHPA